MENTYSYKNTGRLVKDVRTGQVGVYMKFNTLTGQIQILQNIQPYVLATYDSIAYLKFIDEEE